MKNIKWVMMAVVFFSLFLQAEESESGLVCDMPLHHFGEVVKSTTVTNVFQVRNDGDMTVIVKRVYASCSCTKGSIDKHTIDPGETANVTVKFNTKGRTGKQKTSVWVMSATSLDPALKLYLEGKVVVPGE